MNSYQRVVARSIGITSILLCIWLLPTAGAQEVRKPRDMREFVARLPDSFTKYIHALGASTTRKGLEKTVLHGTFVDESERRIPIRVTLQLPGYIRLEGLNLGGPPVVHDRGRPGVRQNRLNEQVLEVFAGDSAEAMMISAMDGAAVDLVGTRFRLGPRDSAGPSYDVFRASGPVSAAGGTIERFKEFFFENETGLLAFTRYFDDELGLSVQVHFQSWQSSGDLKVPTLISRVENGRRKFSFEIHAAVAGPWQDPTLFPAIEDEVR